MTRSVLRFYQYLRGLSFTMETDHLPLDALLGGKDLLLPPRVHWMRIKLMRYQFCIQHVPGKLLASADTLSQAPCFEQSSPTAQFIEHFVTEFFEALPSPIASWVNKVRQHQASDGEYSRIIAFCQERWPDKQKLPPNLVSYW